MRRAAITHAEYVIMNSKTVDLLEKVAREPANSAMNKAYDDWLDYMMKQIIERGLACQDCRLDRH